MTGYRLNYENIDNALDPDSQRVSECNGMSIEEVFSWAARMEAEDFLVDRYNTYKSPTYSVAPKSVRGRNND